MLCLMTSVEWKVVVVLRSASFMKGLRTAILNKILLRSAWNINEEKTDPLQFCSRSKILIPWPQQILHWQSKWPHPALFQGPKHLRPIGELANELSTEWFSVESKGRCGYPWESTLPIVSWIFLHIAFYKPYMLGTWWYTWLGYSPKGTHLFPLIEEVKK